MQDQKNYTISSKENVSIFNYSSRDHGCEIHQSICLELFKDVPLVPSPASVIKKFSKAFSKKF